jgi:hypothetical protein
VCSNIGDAIFGARSQTTVAPPISRENWETLREIGKAEVSVS